MAESEKPEWHIGRYTKPGDRVKCRLCGVQSPPDEVLEAESGMKLCKDRDRCERWLKQRIEMGGTWK